MNVYFKLDCPFHFVDLALAWPDNERMEHAGTSLFDCRFSITICSGGSQIAYGETTKLRVDVSNRLRTPLAILGFGWQDLQIEGSCEGITRYEMRMAREDAKAGLKGTALMTTIKPRADRGLP